MSSENAEYTKEDFEKLRQRYRKEALNAVEEAEARGYEKGKSETLKAVEDQISKWKAIADGVRSNDSGSSKPTLLVKFIMEQVYKDFKAEFSDRQDYSELMNSLKTVLLSSTNTLMKSLPEIVLASSTSKVTKEDSDTKTHNTVITKSVQFVNQAKLKLFCVKNKSYPPKYFIRIKIPQFSENVVKGVFLDSEFISYTIETETVQIDYGAVATTKPRSTPLLANPLCSLDRRHSEFKALYSQLQKEFPYFILPWTHGNNSAVTKQSGKNSGNNNKESTTSTLDTLPTKRKRQHVIWLQFLSNLERLQSSQSFILFLTGAKLMSEAENNYKSNSKLKKQQQNPNTFAKNSLMAAAGGSNRNDNTVVNDVYLYGSTFLPLFSYHRNRPRKDNDNNQEVSSKNSYIKLKLAYQDLQTMNRDIMQLEPNAQSAIDATLNMKNAYQNIANARNNFTTQVDEWSRCEPSGSVELNSLRVLSSALSFTRPNIDKMIDIWQQDFLEYLDFIEGTYLTAARDSLDRIMKQFPCHAILSPATSSNTKETASSNKEATSNATNKAAVTTFLEEQESIKAAQSLAQSYDSGRRVRGSMLMNQIICTVQALAHEHREARKQWEYAYTKLGGVVAETEDAFTSLRHAIQEEMQDYDESVQNMRESFEATNKMQDMFSKLTGALRGGQTDRETSAKLQENYEGLSGLKSFRAIISRPVIPSGFRRDPSKVASKKIKRNSGGYNNENDDDQQQQHQHQQGEEEEEDQRYARQTASTRVPRKKSNPNTSNLSNSVQQQQQEEEYGTISGSSFNRVRSASPRKQTRPQSQYNNISSSEEPGAVVDEDNNKGGPDVFDRNRSRHASSKRSVGHRSQVNATSGNVPENIFSSAPQPAQAVVGSPMPSNNSNSDLPQSVRKGRSTSDMTEETLANASKANHEVLKRRGSNPSTPIVPSAETNNKQPFTASNANTPLNPKPSNWKPQPPPPKTSTTVVEEDPLPDGWEQVTTEDGNVYYYHKVTRLSRWDRPTEKVAAALEARLNKSSAEVDEAVNRRKQEIEQEKRAHEERQQQADSLKSKVKVIIDRWKQPIAARPKDFGELLSTAHTLLSYIPEDGIVSAPLTNKSTPSDLKKAYLKAARFVHPDKLPEGIELEEELIANAIFIVLTDAFNAFRAKLEGK